MFNSNGKRRHENTADAPKKDKGAMKEDCD